MDSTTSAPTPTTPAATPLQIEALLEFLSSHEELARGHLATPEGRLRSNEMWKSLCNSLNAMGGCTKTVKQWKRVWSDKKFLAKKAAGDARRDASATGGGPSQAPPLTQNELRILSIMGPGFGEPQTEARVPAFPSLPPVRQDPAAITPTLTSATAETPAHPLSQEQPMLPDNSQLPTQNQRTLNSRRAHPRVRRPLTGDSARNRIVELEEQRLQADIRRNEVLDLIRIAVVDLSTLIREHIYRN